MSIEGTPSTAPGVEDRLEAIEGRLEEIAVLLGSLVARPRAKRDRVAHASTIEAPLQTSGADFETRVDDPSVGVAADYSATSTTMLIAFAGMRLQMGMPPFEFFSLTQGLPVKRLFVRDPEHVWYHRGVPGYGRSIDELAARLREQIDQQDVDRVVVAGNSAGGYAALLFGTLLEADVVLSFSPKTFLISDDLHAIGDHRRDVNLDRLASTGGPDPRYADLGTALPALDNGKTRYELHYGSSMKLDEHHAKRVAHTPRLTLHPYPHDRHDLIRLLRGNGELSRLLISALETG
jgi:hypothetical protein